MKLYKPKKWLTYLRLFSLIFFVMAIGTAEMKRTSIAVVKNDLLDKSISYEIIVNQQEEAYKTSLYETKSVFNGDLTGYAGDCPLCSGVVACKPRINVLEKGIFFNDVEYGTIRMVASSKRYPCGTILRFNADRVSSEPIIAVVMDRGVGGNNIDLLMDNEDEARRKVGRIKNLEFQVLRLGWK
jgi:3D (Asp-Asp-Asp) domain-containing protein